MRVEPELLKARVGMGVKGRQCGRGRSYTGPMRPIDIKEVTGVGRQKKKRARKKRVWERSNKNKFCLNNDSKNLDSLYGTKN